MEEQAGRMKPIALLMTSGCSLCDDALDLILESKVLAGCSLELVDISTNDALIESYGDSIPVVLFDDIEIRWPFGEKDFLELREKFPAI